MGEKVRPTHRASGVDGVEALKEWGGLPSREHHSAVTKTNIFICTILHWPPCPWVSGTWAPREAWALAQLQFHPSAQGLVTEVSASS